MKVTLENQTRMILKDNNFGNFFSAAVLFLIGIGIIYLGGAKNLLVISFAGIFLIVGIYKFANARSITVSLDKGEGKFKFSSWGILKKEQKEFELGKITGVGLNCTLHSEISYHRRRSNSSSPFYQYQLLFTLADEMPIQLEFGKVQIAITSIFAASPHEKKMAEAKQVAGFLGVPIKEDLPPSPSEIFEEAKDKFSNLFSTQTGKEV